MLNKESRRDLCIEESKVKLQPKLYRTILTDSNEFTE
jgi:hypothetical protein